VTQTVVTKRCRWCRRAFAANSGPGRPREFCRQSCRQRDYEARQTAVERGLDESQLIVTRSELDELRDKLYVLECAVEDVDRDLVVSSEPHELREALQWLLGAARPLIAPTDR
jgi:hypothetical protein